MSVTRCRIQADGNPALPLTTWLQALDRLGLPLLLIDLDGRAIHMTPMIRTILLQEPARMWVLAVAKQVARAQPDHSQPRSGAGAMPDPHQAPARKIWVAGTLYTFRVAPIDVPESGVMAQAGRPAALVAVERRSPLCPSVERLVEQFRLTRREAEVALLLMQRMHNAEIAKTLSISVHTTRHHTQHILEKLNIRHRADVMRIILEGIN